MVGSMKHPFPKQGKESSREANLKNRDAAIVFNWFRKLIENFTSQVTYQEETKCWL